VDRKTRGFRMYESGAAGFGGAMTATGGGGGPLCRPDQRRRIAAAITIAAPAARRITIPQVLNNQDAPYTKVRGVIRKGQAV
jgi:hypothetical protein